jgi:uncharacterized protein (DUF697 family)
MTRKQLPKVIRRQTEDLRLIVDKTRANEASVTLRPSPDNAIAAYPALAVASPPAAANDSTATPPAKHPTRGPGRSVDGQSLAAKRRLLARRLIERHGAYAAFGGLSPLPIANVAGVAAVVVHMVKQLSELYGVPFERDRTRSLVISLVGGAVPTGLGTAAATTLAYIMPGAAFAGLAVSALTAGALTRSIGQVFVESFEREADSLDIAEASYA